MRSDTPNTKQMTLRMPHGLLERIQQEIERRKARKGAERPEVTAILLEATDLYLQQREKKRYLP